ncbi:MAG: VTT domain-containing protein, partial [Candidatus Kapaibacterium sp.]
AAIIGDGVNYAVGQRIGPRVFNRTSSRWLNGANLRRAHEFYEKHGGKTIVLARFMPIIRTFAPFVAGIGKMRYRQFLVYNVLGAIVWVASFLALGYLFGNQPAVKKNFTLVIAAIIVISAVPAIVEMVRARREL